MSSPVVGRLFLTQVLTDGKKTGRTGTGETGKSDNLEDMEMEEEKRHLINREIDKFRDTYKVRMHLIDLTAGLEMWECFCQPFVGG